jgi:MHS family proline/betaine transporter-like MFS transporter
MAKKLTRTQKEAIFLLSIGTLLEYFDLMLYVHLSTILNDLFFPKTDPIMAKLLAVTAFCMTFMLRPVGGYIIGRIGDTIGRKHTVLITTFLMAGSCLTIAIFPTYAEVGIWATVAILLCRMLQGFSTLGEIVGASIYLAETLKSPNKYVAGGIIDTTCTMGGFLALGVASLVLNSGFSWRYAFFIGAGIAVIGLVARRRLRETPEFVSYQTRIKLQRQLVSTNLFCEKIDKKALAGLFLTVLIVPCAFYIAYIYLGDFMKDNLGMTAEDVTNHNFKFSIYAVLGSALMAYLCYKFHPVKIVGISCFVGVIATIYAPYCLNNVNLDGGEKMIYFLQCIIYMPTLNAIITEITWFKYFSISKRFTVVATTFGIASALGYSLPAYGLIPLTRWFGYYGIWVLYAPIIIGFIWALNYLMKLEKASGTYDSYPDEPRTKDTVVEEVNFNYELDKEYDAQAIKEVK